MHSLVLVRRPRGRNGEARDDAGIVLVQGRLSTATSSAEPQAFVLFSSFVFAIEMGYSPKSESLE